MKVLYPNLNILDIRCDGGDDTKEQCNCISIVVLPKSEWLEKKQKQQHEGCYQDFCCLFAFSSKIEDKTFG